MQRAFIVNRDLFTRFYLSQSEEQDVAVEAFGESIRRAGVIDIVRAVATAAAVHTPAMIYAADSQYAAMRSTVGFRV